MHPTSQFFVRQTSQVDCLQEASIRKFDTHHIIVESYPKIQLMFLMFASLTWNSSVMRSFSDA